MQLQTPAQWREFLTEFSRVILALDVPKNEDVNRPKFSDEIRASGFIGFEGATPTQIESAQQRLGVVFPPSYRAFMETTNGWPLVWGSVEPGKLWSTEELIWARDGEPTWVEIWGSDEWDEVSPQQHRSTREKELGGYRAQYVQNLLSLSEDGDACALFLSPEVVNESGEWECWKIGSWCGVQHYESFADWFVSVYEFHKNQKVGE